MRQKKNPAAAHSVAHPKKEKRPTEESQREFLRAFVDEGTIFHGAQKAGIGRRTHYDWLERDAGYRHLFEDAKEAVADGLEREAMRRAVRGVEEPVYYQGQVCGHVRKFSDVLLIFLLKGLRPEKFRERPVSTADRPATLEDILARSHEVEPETVTH